MANYHKIAITKLHIDSFKKVFQSTDNISVQNIFEFYHNIDKSLKDTTVNWRIYRLVEEGVIQRIGRGEYKLGKQKVFTPSISEENKLLYQKLKEEYPFLEISIWSTDWITQWMLHIPKNYETIIEVEKGSEESVFYFLSDLRDNVFMNPSKDILDKYSKEDTNKIIVKNLVTDAPLQKIGTIQISSIEKIIVDLIVDAELFSGYQGRDLDSIIENAYQFNSINEDKLLRYASRRRKRGFVEERLKNK